MAKTLAERITSARNSATVRITDLEKLLPEAELERDRLSDASIKASGESVDFALSDEDRDEAAAKAERYGRTARGLELAIAELREKLDELRSSEAQKATDTERAEALRERDDLAALIRAEFPGMVQRMVDLLAAARRNSDRMRACQVYERDAECEARDVSPLDSSVMKYSTMKLPKFEGMGRIWPPVDNTLGAYMASTRDILEQAKAAREAELARWSFYLVEPPEARDRMIKIGTDRGEQGVYREPVVYRMTVEQVEAARHEGCKVRLAKKGEYIGRAKDVVAI